MRRLSRWFFAVSNFGLDRVWRGLLIVLAIVILLSGFSIAQWRMAEADQQIRTLLLNQTKTIAASLNQSQLGNFTFTPADWQRPYFQRLHQQMAIYGKQLGYRSIYTMAFRSQQIIFGPESLEPDDPLASPVGTVYEKPPPELYPLFQAPGHLTIGPYRDEYGQFISAFSSVVDRDTGAVMAVVGMDIEVDEWQQQLNRFRLLPLGVTLVLVVILLGSFAFSLSRLSDSSRWRYWGSYVTALAGVIITLSISGLLQENQMLAQQKNFEAIANNQVEQFLEQLVQIRDEQLRMLSQFILSSQEVTEAEFQQYTQPMVQVSRIQHWQWAPLVAADQKNAFEQQLRQQGLPNFRIFQYDAQGRKVPVTERADYYPVLYSVPANEQAMIKGYDLATDPTQGLALRSAVTSRLNTATDLLTQKTPVNQTNTLRLYYPVFRKEAILTSGVISAVIEPQKLLSISLASGFYQQTLSDLYWLALFADRPPAILAEKAVGTEAPQLFPPSLTNHHVRNLVSVYPLFIFGKTYVLTVSPNANFWASYPVIAGKVALVMGLGMTILLTMVVTLLGNRRRVMEQKIQERTQALNQTTADLKERIKELNCLVQLSRLTQQEDFQVAAFLQQCVELLPPAFQYPAITSACIHCGNDQYVTPHYQASPWQLTATFSGCGTGPGRIDVYYREDQGFLPEEETLLQTVARIIEDVLTKQSMVIAVQQSERNYRAIFNSTFEAIFVEDIDTGEILDVNEPGLKLYGYPTKAELIGLDISAVSGHEPWQTPEKILGYLQQAKAGQTPVIEWLGKRKDGETFWVEVTLGIATIDHHQRILAVIRDIRERKRQEQRIRYLTRLYATLSQVNQAIIHNRTQDSLFWAICTTVVEVAQFSLVWIGCVDPETQEIIPFAKVGPATAYIENIHVTALDEPAGRGPTGTAARTNQLVLCEDFDTDPLIAPWRDRALSYGFHSSAAVPIQQNNRVVAVLTIYSSEKGFFSADERALLQEISDNISFALDAIQADLDYQATEQKLRENEKKLQEAQLQNLSNRLALALEAGLIGSWEWTEGEGLHWDAQLYSIYGIEPVGRPMTQNDWLQCIHPDDRARMEEAAQAAFGYLSHFETEFRIVRPQGEIRWIFDIGIVHRDPDTGGVNVIGINQDITERKLAELQLQQTNEELVRATRLKDEFLANMSHELRTPLNAILGMTEVLQEEIFGPVNLKQQEALKTVENSGNHLLSLINDILDLSKIESGQMELNIGPATIPELCKDSLSFIKQQAMKKGLRVETQLAPNLPELWVDERRIRQALINLLNNAVKFTPEGGRITLSVSWPTADRVRFSVEDTGIGIAPEQMGKLFQPFIQVDSALNRRYEGTGLGLALVKRIVELHGGEIGLTSQVGVGSCFTLDLPCPEHALVCSVPEASPGPGMEALSISGQSPLILLAEDNESNGLSLSSYLQAKGYRVAWAKDGKAAVAMAIEQKPDLIVMDVQMPEMDGLEAMQRIRTQENLQQTPIIALTALAMEDDAKRCLASGANCYLSKPVRLKELAGVIQELLRSTGA
ncbi:ATP-binding protein [Synechocystis sp. LKSZ1]|uniref:ATP-binding protein n=1 Tax=Synechocystis sp. LKSZ1 TaxID=3144951 RepID=UPI00336C27AB